VDEGVGNVATNSAPGGSNGTIYNVAGGGQGGGSAWVTTDPTRGTVLSFSGDDTNGAYVDTGFIPQAEINGDFTWTAWISLDPAGTGGNDVVLGNRYNGAGGRWAKLTQTGYEWQPAGGGKLNHTIPTDNVWRHYAIVKTGTHIDYYVDSSPVAGGNFNGTFSGAMPFYIGGDANNAERIGGRIDDVATFNQTLSPRQINAVMNGDYGSLAAPITFSKVVNDDFGGAGVNPSIWTVENRGLESTVDGGYNAPSTAGGQLTLGGSTNHSYWAGKSLRTVDSYSTDTETRFMVDRESLTGTGSAYRSSIWLYADDQHYMHFAQNIGENGWQFNYRDGANGGPGTGGGTNIGALDSLDSDGGLHNMEIRWLPGVTTDEGVVQLWLDNSLYVSQAFTDFTPDFFQFLITGQARANGDTVSAVFDNAMVFRQNPAVPEPATAGLVLLAAAACLRRRREA
jgi:Concanavalin A-like lectin/glucanases superfamily